MPNCRRHSASPEEHGSCRGREEESGAVFRASAASPEDRLKMQSSPRARHRSRTARLQAESYRRARESRPSGRSRGSATLRTDQAQFGKMILERSQAWSNAHAALVACRNACPVQPEHPPHNAVREHLGPKDREPMRYARVPFVSRVQTTRVMYERERRLNLRAA